LYVYPLPSPLRKRLPQRAPVHFRILEDGMAEIKIEEKKKRGGLLPLILGAILLLLLLGWCTMRDRTTGTGSLADTTRVSTPPPATAARDFITYVTTRDTVQETEGNHQYTAGGVRRLAAALEEIAGGNPNIAVYADSMRSSVDRLQQSAETDMHADDAKAARIQLLVKVPAKPKWTDANKQGIGLDVLGYRVYSPCEGRVIAANPKSASAEADRKACQTGSGGAVDAKQP
jgi:hypothetical protein